MVKCIYYLLIGFGLSPLLAQAASLQKDTLTIAAVGDIMMGSAYPSPKLLPKDDAKGSFKAVMNPLRNADLTIGNLEGVFLDKGLTNKCKNKSACYAFRMPERYAAYLKDAGFDVLSVANNHSGDFDELGRSQTAKTLSSAGISYAGFKTHPYTIYAKNGIKYAICAFAPHEGAFSFLNLDIALGLIRDLKMQNDIVIVYFHGGAEGSKYQHITRKNELFYEENRGNVYEFAHLAVDAGADLVLGSGPHVSRAVDLYKNRFIAYSLGNFCTYGQFNLDGPNRLAPLMEIKVNEKGEFISAQLTSIKQLEHSHLSVDADQGAWKLIKELTKTDIPEAKLDFDQTGWILPKKTR